MWWQFSFAVAPRNWLVSVRTLLCWSTCLVQSKHLWSPLGIESTHEKGNACVGSWFLLVLPAAAAGRSFDIFCSLFNMKRGYVSRIAKFLCSARGSAELLCISG